MAISLSVIILTQNEEIHIGRCIDSIKGMAQDIYVVDSYSTDGTVALAKSMGAQVFQHPWKNYADQFQWGLDNCPITTQWVMRIDADEYIEPDLHEEIISKVGDLSPNTNGVYLKRKFYFMGKFIRYGGIYPQLLLRIWRYRHGRIEQRWMDEHIVLPSGSGVVVLDNNFVDENLKGITFWVDKHNSYATREMLDLLNNKYDLFPRDNAVMGFNDPQARTKRYIKENIYSRLPYGIRAVMYFSYRYFFRLGFLDGSAGFVYHVIQGLWYRLLVDIKIIEVEKQAKGNVDALKARIKSGYGIEV